MKKINMDVLQKGDIILTTSTNKKTSGVIRKGTKSDISHAMLYVGGSVIDSTAEGVQARNIQKIFYDDSCAIHVLRTKNSLSDNLLNIVIDYARSQIGTRYTVKEAVLSLSPKLAVGRSSKRQFCSRMVANAYATAGINLVDNPNFCTPNDLKKSHLLYFIEEPSTSVTEQEIKTMKDIGDATKKMRSTTNNFLESVRELDSTIETMSDVTNLVYNKPELDTLVAEKLIMSGYLDLYKVDLERFPWRYSPTAIRQYYQTIEDKSSLIAYCNYTMNENVSHWEKSLIAFQDFYEHKQLTTFKLFISLYLTLLSNHELRVESAKAILSNFGDKNTIT